MKIEYENNVLNSVSNHPTRVLILGPFSDGLTYGCWLLICSESRHGIYLKAGRQGNSPPFTIFLQRYHLIQ